MKYMIHTCNRRRWYVNKILIPDMLEQGIKKEDITVAVDTHGEGTLIATMKMFDYIGRTQDWNDIVWHLQDDVLISSNFKAKTEELYGDIICGFCSRYDTTKKWGSVLKDEIWYSFPCIGINNFIAKECARWFFEKAVYDDLQKDIILTHKHDDLMFQRFINIYDKPIKCFNVKPNLVEHIDYLIGGSLVNPNRTDKKVTSYYWVENKKVEQLQAKIEYMYVSHN